MKDGRVQPGNGVEGEHGVGADQLEEAERLKLVSGPAADFLMEQEGAVTHPVPPRVLDAMRRAGVYQGAFLEADARARIVNDVCEHYNVQLGGLTEVVEAIVGRTLAEATPPLEFELNKSGEEAVSSARAWIDRVNAAATDQTSRVEDRLQEVFDVWLARQASEGGAIDVDTLWRAFLAGASFNAPERIQFHGAVYVKAGSNMPEECLNETCTYFKFYLVHYNPLNSAHGRFLEHPAFHFAEEQCSHAQDRVDQWIHAHQDSTEAVPDGLTRLAEFWEGRTCA